MKAALHARVSTIDQDPENQLQELRRYVTARDWTAVEYVDIGVYTMDRCTPLRTHDDRRSVMRLSAPDDTHGAVRRELALRRRDDPYESDGH